MLIIQLNILLERLKNKELIGTEYVHFDEPLAKKYSGIIPIGMWNNMIGIIGKGGTGKTALINKIISDVVEEEKSENEYASIEVRYVAPTHNAVTVLQESLGMDSEEVGSVKTIASLVARNQQQGSDKAEFGKPGDELQLLRQDFYKKELEQGKRKPISGYDIIIIDEGSMISGQDIRDILFRFEVEYPYNCYSPIFIFMGDYRQLPPINKTIDKSFQEGIISATLFSDKHKSKHLELSQIMRSKNDDLHKVFDSIGNQITEQRKDFNSGIPIKAFDFLLFDSVSKKSTANILIVKENHIRIIIDNYVDILIKNKYPYEIFWVHYNNISHPATQKLFKDIRRRYFEKLNLPTPESNVIAVNDYVQFMGSLAVETIESNEYSKGVIKPTARFKVISRGEGQYPLYGLIPLDKFIGININAEFIVVYNRQGKERLVYAMKKGTLELGGYSANTKTQKITVNSVDGKITLDIPYRTIKEHMQLIQHYLKFIDTMFSISYIGSSHTVQGVTIKKVIVGDYNIRQNALYIAERDMESSLYTSLTRASEKLIIIKPNSINIENNQSIFKLVS